MMISDILLFERDVLRECKISLIRKACKLISSPSLPHIHTPSECTTSSKMSSMKRPSDVPIKRSRSKKSRKGKAVQPEKQTTPPPLGTTSSSSKLALQGQKDQEELDLEEAVFGTRTVEYEDTLEGIDGKGKGKMRQVNSDDEEEEEFNGIEYEEDLEETGLERLKDDNVSSTFFLLLSSRLIDLIAMPCSYSSSTIPCQPLLKPIQLEYLYPHPLPPTKETLPPMKKNRLSCLNQRTRC